MSLRGYKGGGSKPKPATEAPDSLRSIAYFRILDLVSEGEIGGLVNGLQSIYLDETPLANADGSLNFQNVHVEQRTGTQDQASIPGYPSVENETSIGVELRADKPWVQQVTDVELSAVRITLSTPQLSKADTSNGNINGYSVEYAIDVATDGGAFQTAYSGAITGKTTTKYQRSHRIDLPHASSGWQVRVRRLTANADSASVADTTVIDSYTEIVDAKLRYPNSAVIGIAGDAAQFSNIPNRAYELWGRLIQVPANYDPQTRQYQGIWDGSFKPAWTDNPAWIFYDLATHKRYGLGNLVAGMVDKWQLYRIAQYCDQLVDDGKGGQEPRFTCNVFLQTQQDAYKLMSDLASVFRGVSYWAGGSITSSADMPADPVYTYTAANVIDGRFTYASSARKTRFTTALVTWNDPDNFYRAKVEYVEDADGLARYGIQQTELTAFGCTSQGQAQRLGRWALLTSRLETDTVTFSVGLDGVVAAPGQIVRIADPARAGRRMGGRIRAATAGSVTLDAAPAQVTVGDTLTVMLPDGTAQTRAISAVDGATLSVSPGYAQAPQAEAVWAVESAELAAQTFRVLAVTEDKSEQAISFTITAVQHVADKFGAVDNGTIIQIPPISSLPSTLQAPPANVTLAGRAVVMQGIATNAMTISWEAAHGAVAYEAEWRKDSGEWVRAGRVGGLSVDVVGIYTGDYLARVRAYNVSDIGSLPAYSATTAIAGKTGAPPVLTSLTTTSLVFGIGLAWGIPQGAEDTQRTELWYSKTNDLSTAIKLGDFAYPQHTHQLLGLAAGVRFYFWGRLVDKTGNIGAFYPAGLGVEGESSSDATTILAYLSGQIDETLLGQALKEKIGQIDTQAETIISQAQAQEHLDDDNRSIKSSIGDLNNQTVAINAQIGVLNATKATPEQATAIAQQTLSSSFGNLSAQQQTQQVTYVDKNGQAHAFNLTKVGITKNGQYQAAGLAVGVETQPDGSVLSQILLEASRVAIVDSASGTLHAAFVAQNGQVFIDQGFIGYGWITNAMIGNVIQSNNYNGSQGWRIMKDGTAEFRNGIFRGDLTANSITGALFSGTPVLWNGQIGDNNNNGGVLLEFTCPAPIRAGELHYPIILCSVAVGRGGGDDAESGTFYLDRFNTYTQGWDTVSSQSMALGKYGSVQNCFIYVDSNRNNAVRFRFRFQGGHDMNVTQVIGFCIGMRASLTGG